MKKQKNLMMVALFYIGVIAITLLSTSRIESLENRTEEEKEVKRMVILNIR